MATKTELEAKVVELEAHIHQLVDELDDTSYGALIYRMAEQIGKDCEVANGRIDGTTGRPEGQFDNGKYMRAGFVNAILNNAQFTLHMMQDTTNKYSLAATVSRLRQCIKEMQSPDSEIDANRIEWAERQVEQAQAKQIVAEEIADACRNYFRTRLPDVAIREFQPRDRAENPRVLSDTERSARLADMEAKLKAAEALVQ